MMRSFLLVVLGFWLFGTSAAQAEELQTEGEEPPASGGGTLAQGEGKAPASAVGPVEGAQEEGSTDLSRPEVVAPTGPKRAPGSAAEESVDAAVQPTTSHREGAEDKIQLESAAVSPRPRRPYSGPPSLLDRARLDVGGYGGLSVAYSQMLGRDGAVLGVEGAVLVDHHLAIGAAGFLWTNPTPGPDDELDRPRQFDAGYVGGVLRYSWYSQRLPVYLTAGALAGAGTVALVPDHADLNDGGRDFDSEVEESEVTREDFDVFGVIQPEVSVHLNLTRWFRLGVSGGYRFAVGIDKFGYSESDVSGLVAGGHVQFGSF